MDPLGTPAQWNFHLKTQTSETGLQHKHGICPVMGAGSLVQHSFENFRYRKGNCNLGLGFIGFRVQDLGFLPPKGLPCK